VREREREALEREREREREIRERDLYLGDCNKGTDARLRAASSEQPSCAHVP
jgi:hypothetical protein